MGQNPLNWKSLFGIYYKCYCYGARDERVNCWKKFSQLRKAFANSVICKSQLAESRSQLEEHREAPKAGGFQLRDGDREVTLCKRHRLAKTGVLKFVSN